MSRLHRVERAVGLLATGVLVLVVGQDGPDIAVAFLIGAAMIWLVGGRPWFDRYLE